MTPDELRNAKLDIAECEASGHEDCAPTPSAQAGPELLSCPFCGTEPKRLADGRVFCGLGKCSAFYARFATVEQWNTRTPPPVGVEEARAQAFEEAAKLVEVCTCGSGPEWRSVTMRYHAMNCGIHAASMIRAHAAVRAAAKEKQND